MTRTLAHHVDRAPIRSAHTRGERAMTLVELMVALTILVAMTTLVAALWSQMSAWRTENEGIGDSLRPQRVAEFMRRQWGERRTIVPLATGKGAVVTVDPAALEFVTAAPALFPDWPLVRAKYIIEREESGRPSEEWPTTLKYEETRITSMDRVVEEQNDSLGEPAKRMITLLTRCHNVHWERWNGLPAAAVARPPLREDDVAAMVWTRVDSPASVLSQEAAQAEPKHDDSSSAGVKSKKVRQDASPEAPDKQAPPQEALHALRLTGMIGKQEFAWPFIVEALR